VTTVFSATLTYPDGAVQTISGVPNITDPTPPGPAFEAGVALDQYAGSSPAVKTRQALYDDWVARCGKPDFLRCYMTPTQSTLSNFPSSWSQAASMSGEVADRDTRGTAWSIRPDCVAFKAGEYDNKLRQVLSTYSGKLLRLILWHEADSQVQKGALNRVDWLASTAHAVSLVHETNADGTRKYPKVEIWTCVTSYNFDPASGRDPYDYVTPGVDGYCADSYNDPSARHDSTTWKTPAALLDRYVAFCIEHEYEMGWMEIGCQPDFADPIRRPSWLTSAVNYGEAKGFRFFMYFDGKGDKGYWQIGQKVHCTAYFPATVGSVTSVETDSLSPATWKQLMGK
jgi:hypothetical protein